jgi:hypothetical protein
MIKQEPRHRNDPTFVTGGGGGRVRSCRCHANEKQESRARQLIASEEAKQREKHFRDCLSELPSSIAVIVVKGALPVPKHL